MEVVLDRKLASLFVCALVCIILENAIDNAFKKIAHYSFGWSTIEYRRKSISNESVEKRATLLQTIIINSLANDLCEKVYILQKFTSRTAIVKHSTLC